MISKVLQQLRTVALLALLMGVGTLRTIAQEFEVGGIWYSILSENEVEVIHNPDNSVYSLSTVLLPETVSYKGTEYAVTQIGDSAFFKCADMVSVTIPKSVINIGRRAFFECSSLKYVRINDSNTPLAFTNNFQFYTSPLDSVYIGRNLEYGSSTKYGGKSPFVGISKLQFTPVKKVEFGDSVRIVGNSLFLYSASLESVVFGNNVTEILGNSFHYCDKLKTILIPASVTLIKNAFRGDNISTVVCLAETPPTLSSRITSSKSITLYVPEGCLEAYQNDEMWGNKNYFARILDIPYMSDFMVDGIKYTLTGKGEVGVVAINDTTKYEGDIQLPETITYNGNAYTLTTICSGAFYQCSLESVSIPATVSTIEEYAFNEASPRRIECKAMTPPLCVKKSFPSSTSTKVYIPEGTLELYQSAIGWSNFSIFIDTTYVPDFTIDGIEYTQLGKDKVGVVTSNRQEIAKDLILPETVENKGIVYKLTEIGDAAFGDSYELTSVVIPDFVIKIGRHAFSGCSNLRKVTIPEGVTIIETGVFYYSPVDTMIIKNPTPPSVKPDALGSRYTDSGVLIVPTGALQTYMNSKFWQDFAKIEEVGGISNVCEVDSVIYKIQSTDNDIVSVVGASGSNIIIPDSVVIYNKKYGVTAIANNAFSYNDKLESIVISEGVTTLGSYAFSNCVNLHSVSIPSTLTIGNFSYKFDYGTGFYPAFYGCRGLEKITVADGHPYLDSRNNCNAIIYKLSGQGGLELMLGCKNTVIPEGVTQIAPYAFYETAIEKVIIPNSVTKIYEHVFTQCNNLTTLYIGSGLTEFATYTYYSDNLGQNVREAISNCMNLTTIVIDENNPKFDSRNNSNAIIETATNTILLASNGTTIPEDVTAVETGAFLNCLFMESLYVPANLTTIPFGAFAGSNNLKSVVVDKANTVYDSRNNCNAIIETATDTLIFGCMNTVIPEEVECIGHYAFYQCAGLEGIVIPDAVHTIGDYAFQGCYHLKTITFGSGLRSIGNFPFGDIRENHHGREMALNTIVFKGSVPPVFKNDYFYGINQTYIQLVVPKGSLSAYQSAEIWKDFTNIIEGEGVIYFEIDGICYSVIIGTDYATVRPRLDKESIIATSIYSDSIVIPETIMYENKEYVVNAIGAYAFYDCRLNYLSIPATVKEIGYNGLAAFFNGDVICYATIPPTCLGSSQFGVNHKSVLRVPEESVELYKNAPFWEYFLKYNASIEPIENNTGIQDVKVEVPYVQTDAVYDLSGRRVTNMENLKKGIYIVNGKKIVIK